MDDAGFGQRLSMLRVLAGAAGLLTAHMAGAETPPPAAPTQSTEPAPDAPQDQDEIATVIVTAQRRAERQQDVPISITVLDATALQSAGIDSLAGISKETPGLRFDHTGAFAQPTIRGVGSAVITSGAGSNIGIYVDGFYNPAPLAADMQFLNVDNVQVLKGPQGTLFGHNTTGGAILVTTTKPGFDTSGTVQASYGDYNAQQYEGYFTTGLTHSIAADVAGVFSTGDGYVHDVVTGGDRDGAYQNWSVRAGIRYDLTPDDSLLLRYLHTDTDDPTNLLSNAYVASAVPGVADGTPLVPGSAYNAYPGVLPHAVYTTRPGDVVQQGALGFFARGNTFQLTGSFDLAWAELTSYTQYSKLDTRHDHEDISYTSLELAPSVYEPLLHLYIPVTDKLITQEFLLNSKPGGRLKWTAGLFYMDYDEQFGPVETSQLGAPFVNTGSSGTDTLSAAAYFDATYQALERLFVTAGVRYSHDIVQDAFYDFVALPPRENLPDLTGNKFSPRAVLRYVLDDASNVYFSFSRGYKSAIYNVGGHSSTPIKPETINAYELGYKYAGHELSFDLAAYYYDYSNLQVASYADVAGVPSSVVNNAANSRIEGLEAQLQYQVTTHLQLTAGAAYTDAKYTKFLNSPVFTQCLDLTSCGQYYGFFVSSSKDEYDADMLRAPKFTANLGSRYTMGLAGGELSLSGNYYFTSKFYFDSSDTYFQKAYSLLGLRAEWLDPSHRYSLALYGDNVTNTHYIGQVLANNPGVGAYWASPATFGGQVKVYF